MNKIKVLLTTGGASAALMLGLAMPAGALTCTTTNGNTTCSETPDNSVSSSPTNGSGTQANNGGEVVTLGDCSIYGDVNQTATVDGDNDANGAADGDGGSADGNSGVGGVGGSASGSVTQSNAGTASNSFSLTCNTTNVTNAAAPAQVAAAPVGGVHAGVGVEEASAVSTVLGMGGSFVTVAAGAFLRKFRG